MSNRPKIEFDSGTAVGFQGWLKKPLRSGGGLGILHVPNLPGVRESASGLQSDVYYQEYIEGKSVSLIGVSHASGCAAIGWTEQLVGAPASRHSESFGYCGSIGPLTISSETTSRVIRAIDHLVQDLGFRGLFGVDAILSRDGVHLVEFNPRYTASCEILELTLRRAILQDHWLACQEMNSPGTLPEPLELPGRCDLLAGKMIVYASQAVAAPDFRRFLRPRSPWSFPFLADIPHIGTQFPQGSPLCTVFATGKTPEQVRERLVRRASRVRRWFGESPQDELPECSI